MAGFLILDFDLFEKYPNLSDGARILYAFISYRMRIAGADEQGQKYINFIGENDPRTALGLTKRQLFYRSDELKAAGLIHTDGQRWNMKVYLGAQTVTENNNVGDKNVTKIEEPEKYCAQNCNQVGDKNVTKLVTKMSPSPFNINIGKKTTRKKQCVYNTPSLEDIEKEISEKHYQIADPQKFFDYNDAKGWNIDWKKALALWAKNEGKQRQGIRSASITGAEAGLVYDCDIEIKEDNPDQVKVEDINPDYYYEDNSGYNEIYQKEEPRTLTDKEIDDIIDIFF